MYEPNQECYICKRPLPANLMAIVAEDNYICPQCARKVIEIKSDLQLQKPKEDDEEEYVVVKHAESVNILTESWLDALCAVWKATVADDPNWEVNFDEYISLAAGMSVRLSQGDFNGNARKCFEELWKFHSENKFKRYITYAADSMNELTYSDLCRLLVLPRPELEQIMELVNFIIETQGAC